MTHDCNYIQWSFFDKTTIDDKKDSSITCLAFANVFIAQI